MKARLVHIMTVSMSLRFLKGQLEYMAGQGLTVHVVASPGPELIGVREAGVGVHPVPMTRAIAPWRDLRALIRIVAKLIRIRPEIVHVHTPKAGLLGMLASALVRTPVRIYHLRGIPAETAAGFRRMLLIASEKVTCALAHEVICVGPSVRNTAIGLGLCAPGKLRFLANGSGQGVDAVGRFNPVLIKPGTRSNVRKALGIPLDAEVVGYVGRLVTDKGVADLANAWRIVRERRPHAHLLLAGPWELKDAVCPRVRSELSADARVHITNEMVDPFPYYAAMDVVVLPSRREGFPNVPLEAAAMTLPVVATRIPGCTDAVVDGITGTLVDVGDTKGLAAAIVQYCESPGLRSQHGISGRNRVCRDFRPEDIWAAIYDTYRETMQRNGRVTE